MERWQPSREPTEQAQLILRRLVTKRNSSVSVGGVGIGDDLSHDPLEVL